MDYCIKNHKGVFIKLDEIGKAVTCVESAKGIFDYNKAKHIHSNLPKALRRMNFRIEAIYDIPVKNEVVVKAKQKAIMKGDYALSDNISRWVDKFGVCADIINEAKEREEELLSELHRIDNEFIDILHVIEIERSKDMYGGWLEYKRIRANREKRRLIKDELLIVDNVLKEVNPSCMQRTNVQKAINGLFDRKYKFKVIEDCDI